MTYENFTALLFERENDYCRIVLKGFVTEKQPYCPKGNPNLRDSW